MTVRVRIRLKSPAKKAYTALIYRRPSIRDRQGVGDAGATAVDRGHDRARRRDADPRGRSGGGIDRRQRRSGTRQG